MAQQIAFNDAVELWANGVRFTDGAVGGFPPNGQIMVVYELADGQVGGACLIVPRAALKPTDRKWRLDLDGINKP